MCLFSPPASEIRTCFNNIPLAFGNWSAQNSLGELEALNASGCSPVRLIPVVGVTTGAHYRMSTGHSSPALAHVARGDPVKASLTPSAARKKTTHGINRYINLLKKFRAKRKDPLAFNLSPLTFHLKQRQSRKSDLWNIEIDWKKLTRHSIVPAYCV